jgi:hypothetical protein
MNRTFESHNSPAFCVIFTDAKAGGAPTVTAAMGAKFKMRPDEALRILNIDKEGLTKTLLDEVRVPGSCIQLLRLFDNVCSTLSLQRYKIMFANNDPKKGGSFYLQSKIYRSKEVLESEVLGINNDPAAEGTEEQQPNPAEPSNTEERPSEAKK